MASLLKNSLGKIFLVLLVSMVFVSYVVAQEGTAEAPAAETEIAVSTQEAESPTVDNVPLEYISTGKIVMDAGEFLAAIAAAIALTAGTTGAGLYVLFNNLLKKLDTKPTVDAMERIAVNTVPKDVLPILETFGKSLERLGNLLARVTDGKPNEAPPTIG